MVLGWKVATKRPKWCHNADNWIDVINRNNDEKDGEEEDDADENKEHSDNDEEEEDEDEEDEDNEKNVEDMEEEEEGGSSEDEDDNEEYEDNEKKVEDMEEEKEGTYEEEDKEETSDEEVEAKIMNKVLRESAERLPFRGGKPWQGEQEDSIRSPGRKKSPLKKAKKTNEGSEEVNSTKFDNNYKDASIFDSICGNDLKKEVTNNVKLLMKSDSVDIFITGPFCNEKNGKSNWIVVYGDYGSAWTLKSQFIKGYIGTLVTKVKKSHIDMAHSNSYHDINIPKYEFGK
jgi:hypothetical protein